MNLEFDDYYDLYKIIVIGNSGTGKTNLIQTYIKQKKPSYVIPTVGIQYSSKIIKVDKQKTVRAQIWDTAGQQQYRSLTMAHYKKALGALIIFDVTNRRSFQDVHDWIYAVRQRADQNIRIGIIGNKSDLTNRVVSRQQGQKMAFQQGAFYMQTNIYDLNSISNAFQRLAQDIYGNKKNVNLQISNGNIDLQLPQRKENDECKC